MGKVIITTGNYSAAYAAKAAKVDVVAAYPITPQTSIIEKISEFIEKGEMKAEYIRVESEHSAMAACIGASVAGARTFTATSAHGLALMHEMLHWAAATRAPVVMAVVNRAMGPPWNIWSDHVDSLSQRDTGWMQFYVESNQEIFDTIIQAYRVAEDPEVKMPAMICSDAFILSHTSQPLEILSEEEVEDFLPPYEPPFDITDVGHPVTHGNIVWPEPRGESPVGYMEFRYLMHQGLLNAKRKIKEIAKEFEKKFGRNHGDLIEKYKVDDADVAIVSMGALAAQAKYVVDLMREEGYRVGAIKLRVFRPFPDDEIREIAKGLKALVVADRNISYGHKGISATEIESALYSLEKRPLVLNFIMGIGGRDVKPEDQRKMIETVFNIIETGQLTKEAEWYGLLR